MKIIAKNTLFAIDRTDVTVSEKFNAVRKYSETLYKPLITEGYIPQPVVYISLPKWHLGHTTRFFEKFKLKNLCYE